MEKLQIENLNQYIDALHACSLGIFSYEDVAHSAQVSLTDIEHLAKWNADQYMRIPIERTADFELLLLCWEPGQKSPLHDHSGQDGWMKVVQGQLNEEIFSIEKADKQLKPIRQRHLFPNHTYHINDKIGIHKISNNSTIRSISLHLYTQPVKSISVYDEVTGACTKVDLTRDTT